MRAAGMRRSTLGATKTEGGTRGRTYTIGGDTAMPFHLWEGTMPNRPLVAMEVFDKVSAKYPRVLREIYGDLIEQPGRDGQGLRREVRRRPHQRAPGRHAPGKGQPKRRSSAVSVVKSVLAAVDVPLIVTGHNHFDKNNEVMKEVAQACAGENLLLNWVETDNYRTIAGAALAYGHTSSPRAPST